MLTRLPTLFAILLIGFALPSFAVEPAPDFTLPTFPDDANIKLTDFKGHVVYLDFWATWCTPCRRSFPWMNEMQERYKEEGLTIIAVSIDKKRELVEQFIKEIKPSFIVAHDPTSEAADDYKLRAMPTTYLIDRKGNLVMTHMGFRNSDKAKMEAAIELLLDK